MFRVVRWKFFLQSLSRAVGIRVCDGGVENQSFGMCLSDLCCCQIGIGRIYGSGIDIRKPTMLVLHSKIVARRVSLGGLTGQHSTWSLL